MEMLKAEEKYRAAGLWQRVITTYAAVVRLRRDMVKSIHYLDDDLQYIFVRSIFHAEHERNPTMRHATTDELKTQTCSRALKMSLFFHAKAIRFSTALQLGNGERIFSQSRFHLSRSRSGTANLIVGWPERGILGRSKSSFPTVRRQRFFQNRKESPVGCNLPQNVAVPA